MTISFQTFHTEQEFRFSMIFFSFSVSQLLCMTNSEFDSCTLLKESCLLQEFSGTSRLYSPSGRQLNLLMTILSPTLVSVPVFVSWAWEIPNSYSPFLPESDNPFRDASLLIPFFFFNRSIVIWQQSYSSGVPVPPPRRTGHEPRLNRITEVKGTSCYQRTGRNHCQWLGLRSHKLA